MVGGLWLTFRFTVFSWNKFSVLIGKKEEEEKMDKRRKEMKRKTTELQKGKQISLFYPLVGSERNNNKNIALLC